MAKTKRTKRQSYLIVEIIPVGCPRCGSTERGKIHNTRTMNYAGKTSSGEEYTRIEWRRTNCLNCGQAIIEKRYANDSQESLSATRTTEA